MGRQRVSSHSPLCSLSLPLLPFLSSSSILLTFGLSELPPLLFSRLLTFPPPPLISTFFQTLFPVFHVFQSWISSPIKIKTATKGGEQKKNSKIILELRQSCQKMKRWGKWRKEDAEGGHYLFMQVVYMFWPCACVRLHSLKTSPLEALSACCSDSRSPCLLL